MSSQQHDALEKDQHHIVLGRRALQVEAYLEMEIFVLLGNAQHACQIHRLQFQVDEEPTTLSDHVQVALRSHSSSSCLEALALN
jgi:hypothetical protein